MTSLLQQLSRNDREFLGSLLATVCAEYEIPQTKRDTLDQRKADLNQHLRHQKANLRMLASRLSDLDAGVALLEKLAVNDESARLLRGILIFVRESLIVDREKLENSYNANRRKLREIDVKIEMFKMMSQLTASIVGELE